MNAVKNIIEKYNKKVRKLFIPYKGIRVGGGISARFNDPKMNSRMINIPILNRKEKTILRKTLS